MQLTSKQPPLAAAVFRPAHAHRRVAMVAIPRCQASNVSETLSKAAGAVLLGAILSLVREPSLCFFVFCFFGLSDRAACAYTCWFNF